MSKKCKNCGKELEPDFENDPHYRHLYAEWNRENPFFYHDKKVTKWKECDCDDAGVEHIVEEGKTLEGWRKKKMEKENFHSVCPDCKKLIPNEHFDCHRKLQKEAKASQENHITQESKKVQKGQGVSLTGKAPDCESEVDGSSPSPLTKQDLSIPGYWKPKDSERYSFISADVILDSRLGFQEPDAEIGNCFKPDIPLQQLRKHIYDFLPKKGEKYWCCIPDKKEWLEMSFFGKRKADVLFASGGLHMSKHSTYENREERERLLKECGYIQ